ncbi:MAG: hypothetical protein EOM66_05020 [Clostridia bacterium]|nr:hypothetical protein [Clostridia bacterium]
MALLLWRWSVKRRILALLLFGAFLLCACAKPSGGSEPASLEEAAASAASESADGGLGDLLGFVIEDDGQMSTYMMMHGFLRTAENLGHPAKLYRAADGAQAKAAVEQAMADGCGALLVANPHGANDEAVKAAVAAGLYTAVPYDACTVEGLSANVVADNTDYMEELSRGIAERMTERSLKSGRILVYGKGTADTYGKIQTAIAQYYPQYQVVSLERTGEGQAAIDELTEYLLYNRDIKGLYAVDTASAPLAVQARNKAVSRFRAEGTPSPSPALALPAGQTPLPTPNPALLTQISITIFGCGLSDENLKLFNDNDIYGLCIEPYYEAAANATMQLDKLLLGEEAEQAMRVNRPIVYAATIDKYLATYEQVRELFGLDSANAQA